MSALGSVGKFASKKIKATSSRIILVWLAVFDRVSYLCSMAFATHMNRWKNTFSKFLMVLFFLFLSVSEVTATHQRAAEITYRWLSGLTYEVTITMYTYTPSPADDVRVTLPISWGDNSVSDIPRIVFQSLPDNYTLNVYQMNHTFPASGTYTISVEDPNRNFGVVNIPNSVNVPIYVESTLVINPFLGVNNSVQLLNPPIDQGCVGKLFIHNPSAFDPDGDSLSYRLVACRGASGLAIPGYTFPNASISFEMNPVTGDLIWESPVIQGEFNIAFVIDEWRNGVKIGSVMRDMQILVGACNNNPPNISTPQNVCVVAGDQLSFEVSATDPDNNSVTLTASGEPFELTNNPAVMVPNPASGTPTATSTFFWNTQCSQIRRTHYSVIFRARDVHPEVSLTSFRSASIQVNAPAVQNLSAAPFGNGVNLQWDAYACSNAAGYRIYRRTGLSDYIPGNCETGVAAATGYQLIQQLSDINILNYRDDDNGTGLSPGNDYCYVVTAWFSNGAESIMSNQACASLKRDLPVLTNVSNDSTNLESGRAYVAWSKPTELDQLQYPGPYLYELYRTIINNPPQLVFTGTGLSDTLFTDQTINLNAIDNRVNYLVKLISLSSGEIGASRHASSVFLHITPSDRKLLLQWEADVPWINDSTEIYRRSSGGSFEMLGTSFSNSFTDSGLINGQSYTYYVRTLGGYSTPGFVHPIVNYSQIVSEIPADDTPPCPPDLIVSTDCSRIQNSLNLIYQSDSCSADVRLFRIYYTRSATEQFNLIDSIAVFQRTYLHSGLDFVTGCYYVKAIDSAGNISAASNIVCIDWDACPVYALPNVFTPNGDQFNDILVPLNASESNPKANIERIELVIFNRWGNIVFETADPAINWDGKHYRTGQDCAEGTYFYTCEVYFRAFDGIIRQRLQGSVMILR